jgi:hypothetical protein
MGRDKIYGGVFPEIASIFFRLLAEIYGHVQAGPMEP